MITLPFANGTSTDRELQHRVALFIQQRQHPRGARLSVRARLGVVTLAGIVPSFHQRQLLVSLARRVAGVVQVYDELEVEARADEAVTSAPLAIDGRPPQVSSRRALAPVES